MDSDQPTPSPDDQNQNSQTPKAKPQFQVVEETDATKTQNQQLDPNSFPPTHGLEEGNNPSNPDDQLSQAPNPHPENVSSMTERHSFTAGNPLPQHDFQSAREHKQRQIPWPLIGGITAAILIVAGILRFVVFKPQAPEAEPSVSDILIESSTADTNVEEKPEATKTLDRQDYNLQVLNGSGITGAAGKLAKVLESAGFEGVEAANADSFNSEGVLIQVKDGQNDLGELIEKDLADDYQNIKVKDNLDENSDYDAVITLGSQPGDKTATQQEEEVLGASDEVTSPTDKTNSATDSATSQ